MSPFTGTWPLVRALLRRHRVRLLAWLMPLAALVAVTVPGYASTYPNLAERKPMVDAMRETVATQVLYGNLPRPGTLGQLMQWETGAYVVILVCVMALLLTVQLTRAEEDSGLAEVVATSGVGRWARMAATGIVLTLTFAALGAACAASLWAVGQPGEVEAAGTGCFAAVVTLTGLGMSAMTLLLAEALPSASTVKSVAWLTLAAMFGLRAMADMVPVDALRWLTWMGLKDAVGPYTDNRQWPLVAALLITVMLGVGAVVAHQRREYGAGLWHRQEKPARPVRIQSSLALTWRLHRGTWAGWCLAVVALAALFGGTSQGMVDLVNNSPEMAKHLESMYGAGGAVGQYFAMTQLYLVILPLIYGVGQVLRFRGAERSGVFEVEVSTGVARERSLAAHATVAAVGALALVVLGAAVQAAVTHLVITKDHAVPWAWWTVAGQAAGVAAGVGVATAIAAWLPRWASWCWAAVAWSGFVVFLGGLLDLPEWATKTSFLAHGPTMVHGWWSVEWPATATVVQLMMAAVGVMAGAWRMRHRDLSPS